MYYNDIFFKSYQCFKQFFKSSCTDQSEILSSNYLFAFFSFWYDIWGMEPGCAESITSIVNMKPEECLMAGWILYRNATWASTFAKYIVRFKWAFALPPAFYACKAGYSVYFTSILWQKIHLSDFVKLYVAKTFRAGEMMHFFQVLVKTGRSFLKRRLVKSMFSHAK